MQPRYRRLTRPRVERYKWRWNLRIKGLKEFADEDARKEVMEFSGNIAPHLTLFNGLGKRFAMRRYRDKFGKITKNSQLCIDCGIRIRVHVQLFGHSSKKPEAPVRRHTIVVPYDTIDDRLISSPNKNAD
ncbi:hypothetical protein M9458_052299 [Cirrhinus mrigala]|uniref:Uncharacterized protein n=1 Tax=Cirrhinus mrigala TaxID=683832 RepID=A0ABD0MUB9_CIRMR